MLEGIRRMPELLRRADGGFRTIAAIRAVPKSNNERQMVRNDCACAAYPGTTPALAQAEDDFRIVDG